MLVSVIVPIYNSEKYLEKCLESIVSQTYKNLEIILVNDCSTDKSLNICKNYQRNDARITIINQPVNMGQVSAYKKGLEIATGEFVGFLDSDDWIDFSMYEKMVRKIVQDNSEMVVCGVRKVYDDRIVDEPTDFKNYNALYVNEAITEYSNRFMEIGNPISGVIKYYRVNKLIKRSIVLNNLKYVNTSVRVFEDNCIIIPCILDVNRISIVPECLYFYLQHSESTMHKFNNSIISSNRIVKDIINRVYADRKIDHNIDFDVVVMVLYTLRSTFTSNANNRRKYRVLKELHKDMRSISNISKLGFNYKIKIILMLLKYRFLFFVYLIFKIKTYSKGKVL